MSSEQIIGLIVAMLVMLVGLAGSIVPGLPSTPLVLAAAIGHRLYFHSAGPATWVLVVLGLITLFSLVLDYLGTVMGAKKFGSTRRGMIGAIVGGVVGLFFSLPGILLGPFLGALAMELLGGRTMKDSARAGVGALLGVLAGALGKVACCISMMGLFLLNVIRRSGA